MFVIFITHTSFQLYHSTFPQEYLKQIHDTGNVEKFKLGLKNTSPSENTSPGINTFSGASPGDSPDEKRIALSSTRLYDFCDPVERGQWLDILIALIEYLRSGESKVGFLNRSLEKNMLNKVEGEEEGGVEEDEGGSVVDRGRRDMTVADFAEISIARSN